MLQESKRTTPLLQDIDDDAGLGVSAKVETDRQSPLQGGEDEKIKVDENDSMMISPHYVLRHGMYVTYLISNSYTTN